VFANDRDLAYGLFLLDARSRRAVCQCIASTRDLFLRALLWGSLWEAVRESELAPGEYLDLALKALTKEADEQLARSLLDHVTFTYQRYLSPAQRASVAQKVEAVCLDRMQHAAEPEFRITYFRACYAVATTDLCRGRLKDLLKGKWSIPGVPLQSLDRWKVITALLARQDPEAELLLRQERQRDTSDEARKYSFIAEAARAEASTKARYFKDYLHNPDLPEDWVQESLAAFDAWDQTLLTQPFLKPALEALPQLKRQRKIFFVLDWLNAFIGGQQDRKALDEVRTFVQGSRLDKDLERKVLEVMDELERTVRIRSLDRPQK
jgi:aminopeptidase N